MQIDFFEIDRIFGYLISVTSIGFSFLTAIFTVRWNVKKQIDITIFRPQKALYVKFLDILLLIKKNPYLQFEKRTIMRLESMQAEFRIFADKECVTHFSTILVKIRKIYDRYYNDRCNEVAAEEDRIRIETDSTAIYDIQAEDTNYKDKYKIKETELDALIARLLIDIKKSLQIK